MCMVIIDRYLVCMLKEKGGLLVFRPRKDSVQDQALPSLGKKCLTLFKHNMFGYLLKQAFWFLGRRNVMYRPCL